jgi:hypothetical protein
VHRGGTRNRTSSRILDTHFWHSVAKPRRCLVVPVPGRHAAQARSFLRSSQELLLALLRLQSYQRNRASLFHCFQNLLRIFLCDACGQNLLLCCHSVVCNVRPPSCNREPAIVKFLKLASIVVKSHRLPDPAKADPAGLIPHARRSRREKRPCQLGLLNN